MPGLWNGPLTKYRGNHKNVKKNILFQEVNTAWLTNLCEMVVGGTFMTFRILNYRDSVMGRHCLSSIHISEAVTSSVITVTHRLLCMTQWFSLYTCH